MSENLYPKLRERDSHLNRRWRLDCDLAYDYGGSTWSKGYRTRWGARIAAWFHHYIASYGGTINLVDQIDTINDVG